MGLGIKKNDRVVVIAGREKSKQGRVLSVYPSRGRLRVERLNIVKKHMKPSRKHIRGGIIEKESPIHISNVMLICPDCNKPTRVGTTVLSDGKKVRVCKKCKGVIDR